ncbi:MAG: DedA family protein [Deltaproteobacteria bacterium]|nr:MAG: DedA family protein [Deltaproteobacteria bacterium]
MELLSDFIEGFLVPIFGDPHVGLFMFVWFSAVFPLAPPEEAFTLLGGACIGAGILKPAWGALAVIGGIIATDITQFWMGRGLVALTGKFRLGRKLIRAKGFQRACSRFRQKGVWAIIGCRFFFGTRAPTYMAAGFMHYPFARFAAIDSSIVVAHGGVFLVIGYIFRDQIDSIVDAVARLGMWNLAALAAIVLMVLLVKRLRNRKAADERTPAACSVSSEAGETD